MLFSDRSCNKWVTARIKIVLEEMLDIEYDDDYLWIAPDSEYIAPHKTMQARQQQLENEGNNWKGVKVVEADSSDPESDF